MQRRAKSPKASKKPSIAELKESAVALLEVMELPPGIGGKPPIERVHNVNEKNI